MPYTTIISPRQLQTLMAGSAPLAVFDCSFELADPSWADAVFAEKHIAGARQAHLDRDLSAHDASQAVNGGRHPLPRREVFEVTLQRLGVDNDMQIVVYDRNGTKQCGRLWWMLKWAGHDAVAVLDGGLPAWEAAGGEVASGAAPTPSRGDFRLQPALRHFMPLEEVRAHLSSNDGQTLIDARASERYRGETEPIDPIAGHIPGALNRPFTENFLPDGRFKPARQLRQEFGALLGERQPTAVVHHCGSGVSAVPNVIAMEIAGYAPVPLFAGGWSEWCRTEGVPMVTAESK